MYTTVVNKLPWHFFRFLMICALSSVWLSLEGASQYQTGKGKGTRTGANEGGRELLYHGDGSVLHPWPKQPQRGGTAAALEPFGPPAVLAPCTQPCTLGSCTPGSCTPGAHSGDALLHLT